MTNEWSQVPLAELLTKSEDWVNIKPNFRYKQITVRLWGQGVVERDEVSGAEIAASRRLVVRNGQFLLSRIDARNGAFGIVPENLDGAVVSSDFPAFELRCDRIAPSYLEWLSKTGDFVALCWAASEGTTNRVRLKEERFLSMAIPLPPLSEQQRIVARIEELAAKIEEARGLRQQACEEAEALWRASLAEAFAPATHLAMTLDDVCAAVIDNLHSTPRYDGEEFPCIRSQDVGRGTIDYSQARRTSKEEFLLRTRRAEPGAGDIVYVREGDVGRCAVVDGSQRFSLGQRVMMFRPRADIILSRFLLLQLMSPPVLQDQILDNMTGTTSRHVNIHDLRKVRLNVPPKDEQQRIVSYLDDVHTRIDTLKRLQAQSAAELDAMLPSILDKAFKGEL